MSRRVALRALTVSLALLVALLLAEDSGDPDRALQLISDAQRNMDSMRKP